MHRLSVSILTRQDKALDKLSAELGSSKSELVRRALDSFINVNKVDRMLRKHYQRKRKGQP